ncbi:hypothetical protein HHI36_022717 [Cryptolaemus montrouzieri]|uniref:Dolichol-phosphate mannosyltransferase subunit 3 n=1 Tax=Cryptolaemus montrouzieri TaxID=559131 RepID=A0ABD2N0Q4_9CUCU
MTKLLEWLTAFSILVTIWIALLTKKVDNSFVEQHPQLLLYSPFIAIILFGLFALAVVLYRTFTFNNAELAAAELQKEIQEARTSLTKLGYKFPSKLS